MLLCAGLCASRYKLKGRPTLGPAASLHMSDDADVVSSLLKSTAVVEGMFRTKLKAGAAAPLQDLSHWVTLFAMARAKRFDSANLGAMTRELCGPFRLVDTLSAPTQAILRSSLPRWLVANPARYPEMLPPPMTPTCHWGDCYWYGGSVDANLHSKCPQL